MAPFQGGDHGIKAHPGYRNLDNRKDLWLIPKAFFTLLPDVYRVTASRISHQVLQAPALETIRLNSSLKRGSISYDNGNLNSKRIYQRNV